VVVVTQNDTSPQPTVGVAPDSANLALVRQQYAAVGDRAAAEQLLAPDVVWDITPGFPRGGIYTGLDSVLGDFLAPLSQLFASVSAQPEAYYEDGDDHVTVLGSYHITSLDGRTSAARFVHLWTIRDGRLARLQQVADTAIVEEAQHSRG
jgi:ketosteroid isomerase-like protein